MDLIRASNMLSDLDLRIVTDNIVMDILWFRAMVRDSEWAINRHMHSSYEFHFIKSGLCRVILDNNEFSVRGGEIYVTAPGVYHEQIGTGQERFIEYSLNCDLRLINEEQSEFSTILNVLNTEPCKNIKDSYKVIDLFDAALEETEHRNIGFYNNIKSLATMVIITAVRDICEDHFHKYEVPLKSKKVDHRFVMIEKYIEDNIFSPITASDISKFMYLSEKQVLRIISKEKGITTKELIAQAKLIKAKEILRNTNVSIKQLSESLGFSSEYYFNQFFKRYESCPPGVYRGTVTNV